MARPKKYGVPLILDHPIIDSTAAEAQSWLHNHGANCKNLNVAIMYPSNEAEELFIANTICKHCPVQDPCVQYALAKRELNGVWGGTTGAQRVQLLRQKE